MAKRPPEEDPASIGNILVEMGLLTEDELARLVSDFNASKDRRLGEYIVRHTRITEHHIKLALAKQQRMRGKTNEATVVSLMEIAQTTHERVMNGADQLLAVSKEFAKANGH